MSFSATITSKLNQKISLINNGTNATPVPTTTSVDNMTKPAGPLTPAPGPTSSTPATKPATPATTTGTLTNPNATTTSQPTTTKPAPLIPSDDPNSNHLNLNNVADMVGQVKDAPLQKFLNSPPTIPIFKLSLNYDLRKVFNNAKLPAGIPMLKAANGSRTLEQILNWMISTMQTEKKKAITNFIPLEPEVLIEAVLMMHVIAQVPDGLNIAIGSSSDSFNFLFNDARRIDEGGNGEGSVNPVDVFIEFMKFGGALHQFLSTEPSKKFDKLKDDKVTRQKYWLFMINVLQKMEEIMNTYIATIRARRALQAIDPAAASHYTDHYAILPNIINRFANYRKTTFNSRAIIYKFSSAINYDKKRRKVYWGDVMKDAMMNLLPEFEFRYNQPVGSKARHRKGSENPAGGVASLATVVMNPFDGFIPTHDQYNKFSETPDAVTFRWMKLRDELKICVAWQLARMAQNTGYLEKDGYLNEKGRDAIDTMLNQEFEAMFAGVVFHCYNFLCCHVHSYSPNRNMFECNENMTRALISSCIYNYIRTACFYATEKCIMKARKILKI